MFENPTVIDPQGEIVTLDGTEPTTFERPPVSRSFSYPQHTIRRKIEYSDGSSVRITFTAPFAIHLGFLTTKFDSDGRIEKSARYTDQDVEEHGFEKVRERVHEDRVTKAEILRAFWSPAFGMLEEAEEGKKAIFNMTVDYFFPDGEHEWTDRSSPVVAPSINAYIEDNFQPAEPRRERA